MAVCDAAVADHRAMKRVRDNLDNGILQGEIDVAALMTGDRLDLVPMLMFVQAPYIARAAVAPEMPRQFLPESSPINREGQSGIIPRRQAADPVKGNQIVCRLWQRHIAPLFGPASGVDLTLAPRQAASSSANVKSLTQLENLCFLVVL